MKLRYSASTFADADLIQVAALQEAPRKTLGSLCNRSL